MLNCGGSCLRFSDLHCTTASAAGEAGSEHLETKVKAETPANSRVISSEPLPTNVSEESESSSQPGEARCVYLSKERRIPVFPFQYCDLILLPPLGEPKPEVVGAEMSAKVSCRAWIYTLSASCYFGGLIS